MQNDRNNWRSYLFFYILSFMILRCTARTNRIIGGKPIPIENYPGTACLALKFYWGDDFRGGATIIHRRWVVTAAHCMVLISDKHVENRIAFVYSNSKYWNRDHNKHLIIKRVVHRNYNDDTLDYDIALAQVKNPFLGENEKSIPIAFGNYQYKDGMEVEVLGWGTTEPEVDPFVVDELRSVKVNIINANECREKYRKFSNITNRMVCAYAEGKDACVNDSGGPLYRKNVLIGIVSFGGTICADPRHPGVYTKISLFRKWIISRIHRKQHHLKHC